MSSKTPFKNAQGIPMCPKCKLILPEGPEKCPGCGAPLWGPKLTRRTALGCLLGLLPPVAIFIVNRVTRGTRPAVRREGTSTGEDLTVEPNRTYWNTVLSGIKGTLTVTVDAGQVPVGINATPLGKEGLTEALKDKMQESLTEVAAGKQGSVTIPVEAGGEYAYFISNDADKPAKIRLVTTLRK